MKGEIQYVTSDIAKVFQSYYSSLYSVREKETRVEEEERKQQIQEYLKEAKLPIILVDKLQELEDPITQDEIRKAINSTAMGKGPGPDGFPVRYYKIFKELLIPKMREYLNKLVEGEEMRKESILAYITVYPQEGKDKTLCSNYRPIALLNVDTKLYTKILAIYS